ncbi:MAG TPA: hypothetical protein VFG69_02175 [Nannocystaceae bacterium]|nr:hypothetical protein [Nannocystaceae bacterium]
MSLRFIRDAALVLVSSAALTVACGDDGDGEEEHGHDEPPVCSEISDVCHDADMGSGMAHECHETAHAGVAADCEAVHDACIAFCTASATGSSGGGEESSSGGGETTGGGSTGGADSSTGAGESTGAAESSGGAATESGSDSTGA